MITPKEGQELPTEPYSHRKIRFNCECGNEFETSWSSFTMRKANTCGSCKLFKWRVSGVDKYGDLTMETSRNDVLKLTQKVDWKCSCGGRKSSTLLNVMDGRTTSCGCATRKPKINSGRSQIKTALEWANLIPELIQNNLPESWSGGVNRKFRFVCKCGRHFERKFNRFQTGVSTCGACSVVLVSRGQKIGNFTYDGNEVELNLNSSKTDFFLCECGRRELVKVRNAAGGIQATCGRCTEVKFEELAKKYGSLTLKGSPTGLKKHSDRKVEFLCDCGNGCFITFRSVFNGATRSCGRCRDKIQSWYSSIRNELIAATFPISKDDPLLEPLKPLDDVIGPSSPLRLTCSLCNNIHVTKFRYIRNGEGLTCGCRSGQTSLAQHEIVESIHAFGVEATLEYEVNKLSYDIFVPSSNLLIEYHGLKWHSMHGAKARDREKYRTAISNGYDFLCIYEDEWKTNKERVVNLLRNRIGGNKPKSIRASACEVKKIPKEDADALYEKHHYIGPCKSKHSYGAYLDGRLLACVSFKTPTRQSSHPWELVRMVSDPEFRVHGVWRKIISVFLDEFKPSSIVSFSDNRLFNGGVYSKIGFRHDGDLLSDYCWVRNKKRYHKSGLRKPKGDPRTETVIREAEGYRRMWDLGKKRWVLTPDSFKSLK